jgi:hypothetical protein
VAFRFAIDFPESSGVHRVRNFGEDLYRAFREDRLASIDLADVDRATTQIVVDFSYSSRRRLKAATKLISEVLAKYLLDREGTIAVTSA